MPRPFNSLTFFLILTSCRRALGRPRSGTRFSLHVTAHQPNQFGPPVLRACAHSSDCLSPSSQSKCVLLTSLSTCSPTSTHTSTCTLEPFLLCSFLKKKKNLPSKLSLPHGESSFVFFVKHWISTNFSFFVFPVFTDQSVVAPRLHNYAAAG